MQTKVSVKGLSHTITKTVFRSADLVTDSEDQAQCCCLLICCLVAYLLGNRRSNMLAFLEDRSDQTSSRAATLKYVADETSNLLTVY